MFLDDSLSVVLYVPDSSSHSQVEVAVSDDSPDFRWLGPLLMTVLVPVWSEPLLTTRGVLAVCDDREVLAVCDDRLGLIMTVLSHPSPTMKIGGCNQYIHKGGY